MRRSVAGQYVEAVTSGEVVRAFVPSPLPPTPPLVLDAELSRMLDRALVALGRLDGVSQHLPDPHLFLYAYVRREAVLSSQIEGTQSSLSDLLLFELDEAPGVPFDDVIEVSNYVAALQHGLDRVRGGFPLSNRLIREVHEVLLSRGRGAGKLPGEFRRSQNWIGGTRPGDAHFVPPPPSHVEECMSQLEQYLHDDRHHPPVLVRAALAHVQFETIHPFLDGNGRVGRLLIPLLLTVNDVLHEPLLYLSLYFKQHRARYYALLDGVRTNGEWEEWLRFFVTGVEETATAATDTAHELMRISRTDREKVKASGRTAGSALLVHEALLAHPVTNISQVAKQSGLSVPAVTDAFKLLGLLGIASEITGRKRGKVFAYRAYMEVLQRGLEPL